MRNKRACLFAVLSLVLVTGCGQDASDTTAANPDSPRTSQVVNLDLSDKHLSLLAQADQLDGDADQTVHRCYTCALGMDGKSTNSARVGDYELHFCSEACVDYFAKQPSEVLEKTKIPKRKQQ